MFCISWCLETNSTFWNLRTNRVFIGKKITSQLVFVQNMFSVPLWCFILQEIKPVVLEDCEFQNQDISLLFAVSGTSGLSGIWRKDFRKTSLSWSLPVLQWSLETRPSLMNFNFQSQRKMNLKNEIIENIWLILYSSDYHFFDARIKIKFFQSRSPVL